MNRRVFGFILILVSVILTLFNAKITGAVVGTSLSNSLSFLALILFIFGLIMTHARTHTLESNVAVYDDHRERNKANRDNERHYFMTDPKLSFGSKGVVSLGEFRKEVERYRADGQTEELIEIIRQEYEGDLLKLVKSDDAEKSNIARQFLRVLNPEIEVDDDSESYKLSREDIREIHIAFKQWDGSLNKVSKDIRRKYDFVSEMGSKHVKLYQRGYEENHISTSSTPSVAMGDILASKIIKMIENNMKKRPKN